MLEIYKYISEIQSITATRRTSRNKHTTLFNGRNAFLVFFVQNDLCWTALQPFRLSYILSLYMSSFYLPKDLLQKFWPENVQNRWI